MIKEKFYINNSEVLPPKNWQEIAIELNYGKDQFPQGNTISITDFEWVRENYDLFIKHIADGLTGGVGIFEAPPLRIDLTDGITTKTVFSGYVDLTNLKVKDRIKVTAKATSQSTVDWVNEVANGFTFEYLAKGLKVGDKGFISSDLYKFMPYVNNSVPNYPQAAITSLMAFNLIQTIWKETVELYNLVVDAANPFTTANAILQLIAKIAYLILMTIIWVKIVSDIFKFVISPVKYHAGMLVKDLMAKACEYLGLTFKSDIWEIGSPFYNEIIIPEKFYSAISKTDIQILGFLAPDKNEQDGFFKGTFGALLDKMKTKYNAKIIVTNDKELIFIRKDKNALPADYQLADYYQPEYTYNTDEFKSSVLIEYALDATDTNTYQNYKGTIYEAITLPKVVNNQANVMGRGLNTVSIGFARASTKTELTVPEIILRDFLILFEDLANVLIKIINVITDAVNEALDLVETIFSFFGIDLNIPPIPVLEKIDLSSKIENRIGMMMLSNDHFNTAKVLILQEGSEPKYNKINPSNDSVESAKKHFDLFYYVNSFVPQQLNPAYTDRPFGNQYKIKDFANIPFVWEDYLKVSANNRIYDSKGDVAIVESLKFYPAKQKADSKVRFSEIYTLNLTEKFLEPDGS